MTIPHGTWGVQRCTMGMGVTPDHGPWVVQQYTHSMAHGLYNNISTP